MCVRVCGCVYKRTRCLCNMWTLHDCKPLILFLYVFLHLSNSLQGHYGFFKPEDSTVDKVKKKKIQDGMSCSPPPKAGIYFCTIFTSNHLPLLEQLCWQETHGSGCSGLVLSKEERKGDFGVILMWCSPAHRVETQWRDSGQKFRDAENILGEVHRGTAPARSEEAPSISHLILAHLLHSLLGTLFIQEPGF